MNEIKKNEEILHLKNISHIYNQDFQKIKVSSKNLIIFDLRNIYNAREIKDLGFKYFGTGK